LDLPTGRRLSPGATLGVGATGRVLAVHDANLDRDVAMKVLHAEARAQPESVARFVAEARIASSLAHPNVLPIYDLDTDDAGRVFFTMQRIAGRSLGVAIQASSIAARDARIASFSQITSIFVGVAQAVAYAHHRGIVHQDIKPDNIMLGDFGEVLLVDWGCATRCRPGTTVRLYGTPLYMSPEQARRDHVDERSDIYCLGAALFHALALRCPTWSEDEAEFWRRKQSGEIDPPTADELRRIPPALIDIALKALQARPPQRYESADALLDDLRRYQAGLATIAHRDTVIESLVRFHRRHAQVLWTAVAAAAIIAVLGALLLAEQRKGVMRWGTPVVEEDFADDGWRQRWSIHQGGFDRTDSRIVSSGPDQNILVCDRRFSGATAIEYDAMILSGSDACDISLIWCRDLIRDASGNVIGMESRYECKVGAFDATYTAIRTPERNLDFADFRPISGITYRVRVEIEDDLMTLAVDGRELCRWRDPLPFGGGHIALYGHYSGKTFDNVRIFSRGVPERLSPLAIGDAYAQDALWEQAARQYRRVADDHRGRALADEAIYREGLCLLRGGQPARAHDTWRAIAGDWRVREHLVDALVTAGDHDAALTAMEDLARGASAEQRRSLAMNWAGFANGLIARGDLTALARHLDFHDRHLHGLMIADHMAAEAMLALRRYEELLVRYPQHRYACCMALQRLERHHQVVTEYPEQRWATTFSALMSGEYGAIDIRAYPRLHALGLCKNGRADEVMRLYGDDDWSA
ncbi:MAG: protein kinase, partial [Planctomycetes bacterium]|nr:protein kinase [Planctomycetota bacterium]